MGTEVWSRNLLGTEPLCSEGRWWEFRASPEVASITIAALHITTQPPYTLFPSLPPQPTGLGYCRGDAGFEVLWDGGFAPSIDSPKRTPKGALRVKRRGRFPLFI